MSQEVRLFNAFVVVAVVVVVIIVVVGDMHVPITLAILDV